MGRRNVSNVPGQALTLMNDPLVIGEANLWAKQLCAEPATSNRERLDKLYLTAFGRSPSTLEAQASQSFLAAYTKEPAAAASAESHPSPEACADLCHVLINMKEFIFID
jgi:hypothetical protein